ncbi:hypothetical protein V5N11_017510 [Cardamine amara subsp. amara]|uniref:Zinc finger PHD-type domain-containing protein n=1 Tax=Cardamine amara subsp. amara TaxID=228776 RepID=A0ABD1B1E2_CARAN
MKFNTKNHPRHFLAKSLSFRGKGTNLVCDLCDNEINVESKLYCGICESYFHESCLTITSPKVHQHTLFFIRRKNSFACNVCGLVGTDKINMYTCVPCDFFVHRNCIFLPTVIKITRHSHRLLRAHNSYEYNKRPCKICQDIVSDNYEGYTCSDKTCDYVAHAFCATRSEVWGGKDVKGESEEDSNLEFDVEVEIYGRAIHHFSHNHNLTRLLIDAAEEKIGKICQACILPIDMGSFLCCKQCDFALHDKCARLPRKMEQMLHRHPLVLEENITNIEEGFFTCSICKQDSCGFMYRCFKEDCEFKIDVNCASFVEPFYHTAHHHPLFLKQQFDGGSEPFGCMVCDLSSRIVAACSNPFCIFTLDFKCATLPGSVKCKYDTHPLTLSSTIEVIQLLGLRKLYSQSSPLWCEICEAEVNGKNLFYTCNSCCTTIHVECILGKHLYMKPGHRIKVNGVEIDIVSNNGASRPTCHTCQLICQDKILFIKKRDGVCFCSIKCFPSSTKVVPNNINIIDYSSKRRLVKAAVRDELPTVTPVGRIPSGEKKKSLKYLD